MRHRPTSLLLAIVIGWVTILATAAPGYTGDRWYEGLYLEIRGAASFLENAENNGGSVNGTEISFDPGVTGSGAVGLDLSRVSGVESGPWRHVRLELEAFLSRNTVDDVSGKGLYFSDVEAFAAGGLFNAYYDFDLSRFSDGAVTGLKPYIGAGVGVAAINLDDTALRDDQDEVLAYQARTGLGYTFTPNVTGSIGYRFFDTNDPKFTAPDGSTFHSEYRSHSVELGLRYTF